MRTRFGRAYGEIDTLPGSSQVAVSHGVFVEEAYRGRGYGQAANNERTEFMREELGYDYALCTVQSENVGQLKLLQKTGWIQLSSFTSRKTSHLVFLYGKEL